MRLGDLAVRILGDTSQVEKDVAGLGASGKVKEGGRSAGKLFASGVSQSMGIIGPAAGAAFAEGVNAAAQFKDQLQTIRTVAMDLSDKELAAIGDQALALSAKTGKPIEDLTAGLYDLVSAGVPAADAMTVLNESSNLAIGGLGTTSEAVDAVTSAMNAYGLKATEAGKITDIFAKAVADGKVTTAEIGSSIATIAPIAAQAGISLEEVSAGYAQLTAQGVPAAEAATKMRSAIVALISPNETLLAVQKETGINFAKLAKEKGLAVALETLRKSVKGGSKDFKAFIKAQGGTSAAFSNALGRVEAYQFALSTTGENFQEFQGQIDETFDVAGLAAEQAAIKMDSPVEKGKQLAAQFKKLQIEALGPFADSLGPAVTGLNQLGGAMGALLRPATLIGGLVGKLAVTVIPALVAAVGGLPVILIAAVIAGIVALAASPELRAKVIEFGKKVVQFIADGVATLQRVLPPILAQAWATLSREAPKIAKTIVAWFSDAVPKVVAFLADAIPKVVTAVVSFLADALPVVAAAIIAWFEDVIPKIPGILATIGNAILTWLQDIAPTVLAALATVTQAIFSWLANILYQAVTAILGAIGTALGALPGLIGQAFGAVVAALPGLIGQAVEIILSLPGRIIGLQAQVLGIFLGLMRDVLEAIPGFIGNVIGFFLGLPEKIAPMVPGALALFADLAVKALESVGALVGSIVEFFLSIPGKIAGIGGKIVGGIINGMASLPGRLANTIRKAFSDLKIDIGPFHISSSGVRIDLPDIKLPSFASGVRNFEGGIAKVHEGEVITNLPRGADVIKANDVRDLMGGGEPAGEPAMNVNVTGFLPVKTMADIRREMKAAGAVRRVNTPWTVGATNS